MNFWSWFIVRLVISKLFFRWRGYQENLLYSTKISHLEKLEKHIWIEDEPNEGLHQGKCWTKFYFCKKKKKVFIVNVVHVSEIQKNLVFTSLLYKSGVKATIRSDKTILSKNGLFVEKWYVINVLVWIWIMILLMLLVLILFYDRL